MKGRKIELTDKEVAYLTKHFKHTKNAELAAKLNIGERSVVRLARKLGLTKTPQFMRKCQQEMTEAAHASHLRNGTYPPKGFIIPKSEDGRFKKGVTPEQRFGKRKNAERTRKAQFKSTYEALIDAEIERVEKIKQNEAEKQQQKLL